MAERNQIYKCGVCGNIIEIVNAGIGQLVCCNHPMELLEEKLDDVGSEKHVPVLEAVGNGVKVKIGSIRHPMEDEHYIAWIELIVGETVHREFLKPGDDPEAFFNVEPDKIEAREYCIVHGLWKS